MTDGPFLEDFKVGDVHRSPAGRTITQADNIWFSLLTNNQNPIHTDAHYASKTEFKQPLVNSVFTIGVVTGLMVPYTSQNGFCSRATLSTRTAKCSTHASRGRGPGGGS